MSKEVQLAVSSFLDSNPVQGSQELDAARELAGAFFGACFEDLGKSPRLLEEQDMAILLSELIPARLRKRDRKNYPALRILQALLDHIESTQVVPQAWELQRALETHGADFEASVRSGQLAGTRPQKQTTVTHQAKKLGRNDPCWCGSGKKFKKCCGAPGR